MDLCSKIAIKELLKKYQIHPLKRLGQNFLISRSVLEKIITASRLKSQDVILEIGPGIGTLTKELALKVKKVIAVEKYKKLVEILQQVLKDFKNIEIIQGDILKIQSASWRRKFKVKNYKIVANLPYYITAPCIRKFLESPDPPNSMVLMVQKEVGERICASPPKMSKLAVFCQFYGKPEIVSFISKKSFWPQPKVDSVILRIIPRESALLSASICLYFSKIVKAGFSQPRKQLINNFSQGFNKVNFSRKEVEKWLMRNNIKPIQRAETLSLKDWLNLTKTFNSIT